MNHGTDTAYREGARFLTWLFAQATPLVAAHPNTQTGTATLRPEGAPRGRSPFVITAITERNGSQHYTINSNGIAQWKMAGIVAALGEALHSVPVRNEAINEMQQPLDTSDPKSARDMARWQVEYPGGTSLSWTAVSGITLHCASRSEFDKLAQVFSSPEKGQSREV